MKKLIALVLVALVSVGVAFATCSPTVGLHDVTHGSVKFADNKYSVKFTASAVGYCTGTPPKGGFACGFNHYYMWQWENPLTWEWEWLETNFETPVFYGAVPCVDSEQLGFHDHWMYDELPGTHRFMHYVSWEIGYDEEIEEVTF